MDEFVIESKSGLFGDWGDSTQEADFGWVNNSEEYQPEILFDSFSTMLKILEVIVEDYGEDFFSDLAVTIRKATEQDYVLAEAVKENNAVFIEADED